MKVTVAAILLLSVVMPVLAQDGEGQKSPFTEEEGQKFVALEQKIREAFTEKQHEAALAALKEQVPILEAGIARVEKGEVDYGEQTKMAIAQLKEMLAGNFYNQACCLSLTGKLDDAVAAFGRAVELGYLDIEHAKMDSDLDPIRGTDGFKKILAGLNYNDEMAIHLPEGLPADPVPLVVVLHASNDSEAGVIQKWKGLADEGKFVLAAPRAPFKMGADAYDWKRYSDDEESALRKILATVEFAKGKHAVNPAKVFVVGLGSGGYFASLLALTKPDLVKGAVPVNAFWNKYYFEDYLAKGKEGGAKICFVHGTKDPFFGKAEDGLKQLTAAGIGAKLVSFDGGKELPEGITSSVKEALTYLGL